MSDRHRHAYDRGDYVAWYFGITQYRGHVMDIFVESDEIVVRSTGGVTWHLRPDQIERLGSLQTDEIMEVDR